MEWDYKDIIYKTVRFVIRENLNLVYKGSSMCNT